MTMGQGASRHHGVSAVQIKVDLFRAFRYGHVYLIVKEPPAP
jgi:hypothetical protein